MNTWGWIIVLKVGTLHLDGDQRIKVHLIVATKFR